MMENDWGMDGKENKPDLVCENATMTALLRVLG